MCDFVCPSGRKGYYGKSQVLHLSSSCCVIGVKIIKHSFTVCIQLNFKCCISNSISFCKSLSKITHWALNLEIHDFLLLRFFVYFLLYLSLTAIHATSLFVNPLF